MPRFLFSRGDETDESSEWPKNTDHLWVDLGPKDEDSVTEVVDRLYPAHPKVIEHVLMGQSHRPNLIVEDGAVSFMLALIAVNVHEPPRHLAFIIGKNFVVTAHLQGESKVVNQAFSHILGNKMMNEGVDFALYQLLTAHVVALRALANHLDSRFEGLHRMLLTHPYRDLSPHILTLRKEAMAAKHVLDPEGAIFELLKSSDFPYVQTKNQPYFQDVAFLMNEVVAEVQQIREGLAEMVEAYTSLQSNEINKVMWFLTIVSTLALPATTIASIYGMNFVHMPELHWRYGYWYTLSLMFVVSVLLLLWMRMRRRG